MSFLLQTHFDSNGPTSNDVSNLGGVSFTHDSKILNGNKCAFFEPCNDNTGLEIKNNTKLALSDYIGEEANDYTIYFKFCINLKQRTETSPIPILSYINNTLNVSFPWINIEGNSHIAFYIDNQNFGISKNCDWVFDDHWHTCVITKTYGMFKLFLDGFLISSIPLEGTVAIKNAKNIYIGREGNNDHFNTLYGMIDDFCIVDTIVYVDTFIPPNVYWTGEDNKDNFYNNLVTDMAYMPRNVMDETEQNLLRTAFHINETQKSWLPRRLRIQWHEEDYLWDYENFYRISESRQYTALSLFGLEQPLLMEPWNDRFVQIFNARNWVENHKIYPFMLFIDKEYIKLSDIYILKSDQYYTVFINNRVPNPYKPIKVVELVLIPFFCIYEEDEAIRKDLPLLYTFDQQGYFNPRNAYTYYYLDPIRSPEIDICPIMEEYLSDFDIESADDPKGNLPDWMILKSAWRYGSMTPVYSEYNSLKNGKNCTGRDYKFTSSNNEYKAQPGDHIILYSNGVALRPYIDYDLIGEDLFRVYYIKDMNTYKHFFEHKVITMQKVYRDEIENIYESIEYMTHRTVIIEEDETTQVRIPEVKGKDLYPYDTILAFRGGVCLSTNGRTRVSFDQRYLIFTHPKDQLYKGDIIEFVYMRSTKADPQHQIGMMHVLPLYFYQNITENTYIFDLPEYKNIVWDKSNIFMFVNGSFIDPERYTIKDQKLTMKNITNSTAGDYTIVDDNTLVLLHFDDLATKDKAGNTFVISGTPTLEPGKFGNSVYLESGSALEMEEDINLMNIDFTIDFWLKLITDIGENDTIYLITCGGSSKIFQFTLKWTKEHGLTVFVGSENQLHDDVLSSEELDTIRTNWFHLAFVYDSTNNTLDAYIQGVKKKTITNDIYNTSIENLFLDYQNSTKVSYHLDEFRISNIKRFTDNFTPPIEPYLDEEDTNNRNRSFEGENKEVMFVAFRLAGQYQQGTDFGKELIRQQALQGSRFILYDLNIDKQVKITLDNFVVFDQMGRYMPEFTGEVLNRNIVKYLRSTRSNVYYQPRYLTCVYSKTRSLPNHANTVLPQYDDFFNSYIRLIEEFYELDIDFELFMRDYNIMYSRNEHYATNLSRAFYYTIQQNEWNFINLYKQQSTCQRLQFSAERLNDLFDHNGKMRDIAIERGQYINPSKRSFSIFFQDGIIPEWYDTIKYNGNQFYIQMPGHIPDNADLECFRFHDMQNELQPLKNKIT